MDRPSNILVFRIGQLGDTMIALPAIWAVRRHFPGASLTLLCDRQVGKNYVLAPDLLRESGLFKGFIVYPFDDSRAGRLLRPVRMLRLLLRLRAGRFDTLIYLAPNLRTPEQVARDRRFFRMAGLREAAGFQGFLPVPPRIPGSPMPRLPHESDALLARLAASGIAVPTEGRGEMNLGLGEAEDASVRAWVARLPGDAGRPWIGVGPGSKMPAKIWPEERFREVVTGLISEFDVWPVIVGGPEDRQVGERLLRAWGRGYNGAGELGLRPAAAALKKCRLYLGNDSGAMHLAASAGIACVAIFSSRESPGSWYPYGEGHRVFRTPIACEGCMLVECVDRSMECLTSIRASDVLEACRETMQSAPQPSAEPRSSRPEFES